jgi:O-antigen/teichoic acid export membrane protein
VALGLWLIPTYGLMGAALTVLASYATQATVAFILAQRVYRVHYEGPRLTRIVFAGVIAALAGLALPALPPLVGLLARSTTTVVAYAGLLWMTGFLRASERQFLTEMRLRWKHRRSAKGTDHAR